jgi:hypothetical protein
MDNLVRRGLSHILGAYPRKPFSLTPCQELYYKWVEAKMQKEPSELASSNQENATKILYYTEGEVPRVMNDDELWLACVLRRTKIIEKYLSSGNAETFKLLATENDVLEYLQVKEAVNVIKFRYVNERGYFTLVKEFYKAIINSFIKSKELDFYTLSVEDLEFIRINLGIDTMKFELSPGLYYVYRTKDYSLIGLQEPVNDSISTKRLLVLNADQGKGFSALRKLNELIVNSMGYFITNSTDESGHEILDYPWFRLKFDIVKEDKVKVSPVEGTKAYTVVYKFKVDYKVVEQEKGKILEVDGYGSFPIEKSEGFNAFIKHCSIEL